MYKVLVLKNKLPFEIFTDCQKATEFFKTRVPFPISFEFKEVEIPLGIKKYKDVQGFSPTTGQPSLVGYYGLIDSVKDKCRTLTSEGKYDAVIFAWNLDDIPQPVDGVITSWANLLPLFPNTEFIQISANQYHKNLDKITHFITHELMHIFCYKVSRGTTLSLDEMDITKTGILFKENDNPESLTGNYALTLANLKPYFDKIIPSQKYKYFKDSEIIGLKPELVLLLDKARELAGIPFIINSGLRTALHNQEVGGVESSSHTLGEAVDLRARTSNEHFIIVKSLMDVGCTRISRMYQNHVHVDISKDKAQKVLF